MRGCRRTLPSLGGARPRPHFIGHPLGVLRLYEVLCRWGEWDGPSQETEEAETGAWGECLRSRGGGVAWRVNFFVRKSTHTKFIFCA